MCKDRGRAARYFTGIADAQHVILRMNRSVCDSHGDWRLLATGAIPSTPKACRRPVDLLQEPWMGL